eukprot:SAG25_NODE_1113_length_3925_cov_8.766858_1_plen_62_part_00
MWHAPPPHTRVQRCCQGVNTAVLLLLLERVRAEGEHQWPRRQHLQHTLVWHTLHWLGVDGE